jgi:hypothetical protein
VAPAAVASVVSLHLIDVRRPCLPQYQLTMFVSQAAADALMRVIATPTSTLLGKLFLPTTHHIVSI